MSTIRTDITVDDPSAADADPQRELIQLLRLANAQITCCLQEGTAAMHTMTMTFTNMTANLEAARQAGEKLTASPEQSEILHACLAAARHQQDAVTAMQFYDRVAQRLTHVSDSLTALNARLEDAAQPWQTSDWQGLCEAVQAAFTMEAEHRLFDAILSGANIQQAISHANRNTKNDDVEFF